MMSQIELEGSVSSNKSFNARALHQMAAEV